MKTSQYGDYIQRLHNDSEKQEPDCIIKDMTEEDEVEKIASEIIKTADLLTDIERILKINVDDKLIASGMKYLRLLDRLELKSKSVIDKNQINDIKSKIKKAMELIQESNEELFNLHQQMINEQDPKLQDIE
jgi:hypothetical protein